MTTSSSPEQQAAREAIARDLNAADCTPGRYDLAVLGMVLAALARAGYRVVKTEDAMEVGAEYVREELLP